MEENEIYSIVSNAKTNKFKAVVKDWNGNSVKRNVRLFIAQGGRVCEFKKGSTKRGYPIREWEYESLSPIVTDEKAKLRRFLQNSIKYLSKSGLWPSIKRSFELLLTLDDDTLFSLASDYGARDKASELFGEKITWFCDDMIRSMRIGIKSVNYNRWDREEEKALTKKYIEERKDYYHKWTKGYDNSVEVKLAPSGELCGWYSEERRGTGNGHYYALLDESHAIFGEDD
jgi:hypothetical protein